MKTMMMAVLVSLSAASVANAAQTQVASAGSLRALVKSEKRVETARYTGIERVRDSFRDGAHGRGR